MPFARKPVTALAMICFALAAPAIAVPAKKAAPKGHALAKGDITRAQMLAEVRQVFDRADTNHDGFMSRTEFAVRMSAILNRDAPPTQEAAQQMLDAANNAFDNVDTNHDGKLTFTEASARPLKAFDMMDTNHDGILTLAEKTAAHQDAPTVPNGPTVGEQQAPGR